MVLIKLLIAHLIGDFVLQTKSSIAEKENKKHKSPQLYLHVLTHGIISLLLLWSKEYLMGIFLIMFTHLIIDLWKITHQTEENKQALFVIDQLLHFGIILTVGELYSPWISESLKGINNNQIYLFILAMLLITTASSHFIKVIISKWQPENEDGEEDSLTNAGSYIGILERLFVFGFVVSGNMQAIGFLLAAKSVFRFGDLKDSVDRKLTEYILIGTLLSFGLAILIGFSYLKIKI